MGTTRHKEETTAPALAAPRAGRPTPRQNRDAPRHNPVGTQHADFEIGNVHGPTLALAIAGLAAVKLGHHALEIGTLGDAVSVPAVGRDDLITLLERCTHPNRHRLLADVAVHDAVDLAGVVIGRDAVPDTSERLHLSHTG